MNPILDILLAHPEANLIGGVSALLGAAWPLLKTRRGMLLAQAAIHVGMCLHFYLLGAMSGSLMNALGLGQTLAAVPLGNKPGFKIIYIAYLPLVLAAAVLTWQGPMSLFAAFGLAGLSLARYQTDVLRFRVLMLTAIFSWSVYDIWVVSIPAMVLDAISLGASLVMIRREFKLARQVL